MPDVAEPEVVEAAPPEAPVGTSTRLDLLVTVAATYTAEPIEEPLRFWLDELGFRGRVEFAPYNQVIQQLLDPSSEFGRNRGGVNLLLVRFEDWARFKPGGWDARAIRDGVAELISALSAFVDRSTTPLILAVPPASPRLLDDPERSTILADLEAEVRSAVEGIGPVHWLGWESMGMADLPSTHDEAADRVGHMPYTPVAVAAMATAVARRLNAIKFPPCKVLALDCDNTLWKGVVGEDGPRGVTLGPGMKAFQEFIVEQQAAGMVVCLVSKNAEADVLEAFDLRDDFPLRREHLVSWRIGWGPKSQALVELAQELNLGLDSFLFLDDNPVECAEVRAALPQVLTMQVPGDDDLPEFLRNVWAFDRLTVTEEDQNRTAMYRQNAVRSRVEGQAADIGSFLASLDLKVDIAPPSEGEWARVSQLTQRTNQFNFTTTRRSEAEVRQLGRAGLECLRVNVSDRFGDYGLVGVAIFGTTGDALTVDTMLLSCRVLGRGVEHAMLAHLGKLAVDRGIGFVEATFVPSAKNEPASRFLESVAGDRGRSTGDGQIVYRLPAAEAAASAYRPGDDAREQLEFARTGGKKKAADVKPEPGRDRSASYSRIANELRHPEAVLKAVEAASTTGRTLGTPIVEASTAVERELISLWQRVLHVDRLGVRDEFTAIGGTSIKAARLFVEIEAQFGVRLPMTTILEADTVEKLAARVASAGRGEARDSLKLLKPGLENGPALFLVHDGDGETLLYLNLARRMPADVAVFGLEPMGNDRCPILHASLPEMASHYVARVREAQPEGPYQLGGMCAGGTIAFEMALQLRAIGQEVGFVALLDASDSRAKMRPFLKSRRRLAGFLGSRKTDQSPPTEAVPTPVGNAIWVPESKLDRVKGKAAKVLGKVRNLVAYELGELASRKSIEAKVRVLRDSADRGGRIPKDFEGPSVRSVYGVAERAYSPRGKLDARVILVRAGLDGSDHPGDEPHVGIYRDPYFGWGPRVEGGSASIEVVDVPGGHGGMLQEPNVARIAGAIESAIAGKARP